MNQFLFQGVHVMLEQLCRLFIVIKLLDNVLAGIIFMEDNAEGISFYSYVSFLYNDSVVVHLGFPELFILGSDYKFWVYISLHIGFVMFMGVDSVIPLNCVA